jgi:type II secretory pathway component GspD/PulD (secretin)
LPVLPITQLDTRQADPDLDGRRLSLTFSRPTAVREILMRLVRNSRLSVIADATVDQTFVGDLKNVSVREALDLIVEPLGLNYSIRGQVIRVFPQEPETGFYNIDYVLTQRDSPNLYADLTEGVRSLLSDSGRMNLDRTAAMLGVTDRSDRLSRVEQYLEAVMLRVTCQVQIEASVIEVELRDEFSAGIDWHLVLSGLTASQPATPVTSGGLTVAMKAGDSSGLLRALAAQGTVNVLSSPRFTAMNNEPAFIRVGTHDVVFDASPQADPQGRVSHAEAASRIVTEGVHADRDATDQRRRGR